MGAFCRGHKSVVFVLDEFDLFAKPLKQTVLYNLLDALQASNIQVGQCSQSAITTTLYNIHFVPHKGLEPSNSRVTRPWTQT